MFSTVWFQKYHVCYEEEPDEDSLAQDRILLEELVEFVRSSEMPPLQQDYFLFYGFDFVPFKVLVIRPVDATPQPVSQKINTIRSVDGPFKSMRPNIQLAASRDKKEKSKESFAESWKKWTETAMMSPSTLMGLQQVPVEFLASTCWDEKTLTVGTAAHSIVPLLYATRGNAEIVEEWLQIVLDKFHPALVWKIPIIMHKAVVLLNGCIELLLSQMGLETDDPRVWDLFPTADPIGQENWIMFDAYLGPIPLNVWNMCAKPDVIVKLGDKILVLELKTTGNLDYCHNFYDSSQYRVDPLVQGLPLTHRASGQIMLAFSHYILFKLGLATPDTILCYLVSLGTQKAQVDQVAPFLDGYVLPEKLIQSILNICSKEWTARTAFKKKMGKQMK